MPEILQNIIAENRLENIRVVSEDDDVIGGQPKADGMDQNDNNAIFDLACTMQYTLNEMERIIDKLIPVGTTFMWDFETPPDGYVFKKGQAFTAEKYPKLAQLYPSLRLPDWRGVVPRGVDDGRGLDAGRVLGSYQEDAMQDWYAQFTYQRASMSDGIGEVRSGAIILINSDTYGCTPTGTGLMWSTGTAEISPKFQNGVRSANETRMKNIATNFIIKAG